MEVTARQVSRGRLHLPRGRAQKAALNAVGYVAWLPAAVPEGQPSPAVPASSCPSPLKCLPRQARKLHQGKTSVPEARQHQHTGINWAS